MQILKSPLGIKSPLLGIGASLSPPSLLLQKSSFPTLLHGLIKPSTPLESSFSLSRSDFSQLSDGHVTEWNANKPHFEIHSFQQNNTIEVGKLKNNQLAKSSKKRVVTNTDSQSTDELTLQKQSKPNKKQTKSKNNQKQSKSKKVAGASVSVEKVSQSLKQINSHDSIDSSEKISVNNALGDMTRELAGEFLESSHSTLQERQTVLRNPVDSEFPSVASSAPVMPLQELESDVTPTREQNILTQHPIVVESPQFMESKTTSGDTTQIQASPQHRELLNLTSTSTPPQNILAQHPVVVESPQFVDSKTASGNPTPIQASPQHRKLLNLTSTSTPPQNILAQHPIVVESPQFMDSKTASGNPTPIQASPQHRELLNLTSTSTPPQNILAQHPVVVESPQFVDSKTASGNPTPIQASPQHRELLNLTSTSTPPQNILAQHPVVVESPQFVESKTTSGDTTPIQASPQYPQLPNIIPPVLDGSSTLTPRQNLLTQHPIVVESPQFVESKTTSDDATPIQASPQHRELLNLTSTSTPPQNILTQHPIVVESPQFVESKTKSGDATPIPASPQHPQLPNIIPPVLDGSSTLTPPQNILTQHPIVAESPQFVELKTKSGDTTPIPASPQHPQLPNIIPPVLDGSSTLTPPQNILTQHPIVAESPQFVDSKTTSGDTTPIPASPQHPQLPNIIPPVLDGSSTLTPPQNLLTQHPIVEESPQFVDSKTASGNPTPIQALPQHRELPNIIPPVLDGSSTLTPPQNLLTQHPIVVESPQFVDSKTTSGDTTPIPASPQHRELLNLTSTSTPPQNILTQHPIVEESPQFVDSKTTSGDATPIQALPQHRELPNIIPPVLDADRTLTPPQNLLTQHPIVAESPQFVESKTTSGDTTPIPASPQHRELLNLTSTSTPLQNILTQHPIVEESPQFVESKTKSGDTTPIPASPQHPQLPDIIPPVLDADRTEILPQDIDLANTSNQVLQTTFKLDDGFNDSTHLQTEAVQKSVQSPPSLINTSNNTSVLNITSDLGVQPTASESLPAVPNPHAYSEVNVNGKNSSNTVDGEMRSHFPTSEPGEGARKAFINDSTEIKEDLPPPQGYAVGGHVRASNITGIPKVAQSDTIPAMLTPREFVVNAKDAHKNLNLLKHINTSGIVPDDRLTSPPSINKSEEQADEASVKTSTKVESSKGSPVQRKSSDERVPGTLSSLVSSSPLLKTEKQGLTTLSSLQSNSSENKTTKLNESSSHYSSTPLIFRQRISTTDSSSYSSNSPSQWTRIEELVNGSNRTESSQLSTPLSFVSQGFDHQNSASTKWRSPKASTQNLLQLKSFANGKSGNTDTFTPLQPVTEIIERPSSEPTDTDSDDLETLAREIYHRLRQRLELERERHGSYSGRLPW